MTFNPLEYKIEGDYISISRKALEEWAEHYLNVAKEQEMLAMSMFYSGKREVLLDILKH